MIVASDFGVNRSKFHYTRNYELSKVVWMTIGLSSIVIFIRYSAYDVTVKSGDSYFKQYVIVFIEDMIACPDVIFNLSIFYQSS